MSQHDDTPRPRHMLDHAIEAVQLTSTRDRSDLDRDRLLSLALVRLIEIVGEPANRVTSATQDAHPSIPWRQISGARNRLIHGYDDVDFDILWDTIQLDLPPLIEQLKKILE